MALKLLPKPRTSLREMFVPVIFANGEDDDLPGMVACFEHKPVQYGEHIYAPSEDITIENRTIVLSRPIYVFGSEGEGMVPVGWENAVKVRAGDAGRYTTINDCHCVLG